MSQVPQLRPRRVTTPHFSIFCSNVSMMTTKASKGPSVVSFLRGRREHALLIQEHRRRAKRLQQAITQLGHSITASQGRITKMDTDGHSSDKAVAGGTMVCIRTDVEQVDAASVFGNLRPLGE